ncbi:hypothetical protein ACI3ER_11795 [Bacillus sp. Wb]
MEISKVGFKILKHLKRKNDSYVLGSNKENENHSSMCHFDEIKALFPNRSYAGVIFELKSLMEEKLILVNIVEDNYSFPKSHQLQHRKIKFGISGRGNAFVEQRIYKVLSKYLPFSISVVSLIASIVTIIFKFYGR